MKAIIYTRVSKGDKDKHSLGIEAQLQMLKNSAKPRPLT
jgi:DNA invertase Pin-like site-specific DNA recombinase